MIKILGLHHHIVNHTIGLKNYPLDMQLTLYPFYSHFKQNLNPFLSEKLGKVFAVMWIQLVNPYLENSV